jgi:hypothetical protein
LTDANNKFLVKKNKNKSLVIYKQKRGPRMQDRRKKDMQEREQEGIVAGYDYTVQTATITTVIIMINRGKK